MNEISESKLATFFSGMNATMKSVKEVQKQYDPIIAFEFNSLNFWNPGENKVSEILAFFLNPKGKHGQGDIFIRKFIDIIGLSDLPKSKILKLLEANSQITVTCEYVINNQRRIDILLTFGKEEFALAIENKLWAIDQPQQLNDYNDYLSKKFYTNYCLLYLTPYFKNPSEESISKEKMQSLVEEERLQVISYEEEVIKCIHEWVINCRAERVRSFLNDFEQYLKQIILGEKFMSEHKMIVDYALSENNVEAAIKVITAAGEIKTKIFENFRFKLEQAINKEFSGEFKLEVEYNSIRKFWFRINNLTSPNNITFGIADYDPDRVHFFVKADIPNYELLYTKLKAEFGGSFNPGNWFLNLEYKFNRWDENPEGLLAFSKNEPIEALDYIVSKLILISNSIREYSSNLPMAIDSDSIQLN